MKRNRNSSIAAAIAMLFTLALALGASSCVSTDPMAGYVTATASYSADAATYGAAFNRLNTAASTGKLTRDQYNQFTTLSGTVRAYDTAVKADLDSWKSSKAKPASYDADAANLKQAQAAVESLAGGVQ